jgi:hypothetical protein
VGEERLPSAAVSAPRHVVVCGAGVIGAAVAYFCTWGAERGGGAAEPDVAYREGAFIRLRSFGSREQTEEAVERIRVRRRP